LKASLEQIVALDKSIRVEEAIKIAA